MTFGLDTCTAGDFTGTTVDLNLASRNPDTADLDLAPITYTLNGIVNAVAEPAYRQTGGEGTLGGGGAAFLLDCGTLDPAAAARTATLDLTGAVQPYSTSEAAVLAI